MLIGVVGVADALPDEEEAAEDVGQLVAEGGHIVLCGGRGGVMAAVCRGAIRSGGLTVGILPGENAGEANRWVSIPIPTGIGEARNAIIARAADALIAIGTGWGTLSEVAMAVKLGKPVVALGTSLPFLQGFASEAITWANSPQEAVEMAVMKAAGKPQP